MRRVDAIPLDPKQNMEGIEVEVEDAGTIRSASCVQFVVALRGVYRGRCRIPHMSSATPPRCSGKYLGQTIEPLYAVRRASDKPPLVERSTT